MGYRRAKREKTIKQIQRYIYEYFPDLVHDKVTLYTEGVIQGIELTKNQSKNQKYG